MAYEPKNLSVLAYANGFTMWHYRTTDTYEEVTSRGYFNGAADMVRAGDMIILNSTGFFGSAFVSVVSVEQGVVTID